MKKAIMTLGVLTAMSPMLNVKVSFADNVGLETVENRIMRNISEEMNVVGKVVGVKSDDVLNIRTGPTVKAKIIGGMRNGSTMKIEGRASNGWYKVNYNGVRGYSSNDFISISSNSQSSVDIGKQGRVNVKTSLNIRKSPTTSSSIIGSLRGGDVINVISKHGDWYYINSNGKKGYVYGEYVVLLGEGVSSNQNSGSASNGNIGKIATVTADVLNVRSGAGTNYSVINKVYYRNTVKILEASSNGWYKVQLSSGASGWCSGDYLNNFRDGSLTQSGGSSSNNSLSSSVNIGKIATVTADALNVRSGAGTNYSVLSKVYCGNTVKVLDASSNGWYKIQLSSGVVGWSTGEYLSNFRDGSLNQSGSSNGSVSMPSQSQNQKIQSVINVAKSKLGSPYVWGAEGPSTFDCSGLTLYAFKNGAGVTLPRVSRDQAKVGNYVSKANLMPGDLVFFDHNGGSNINHVGIYIGNNEMIHSPQEGDVVKVSKINTNYYNNAYVTARRIIN